MSRRETRQGQAASSRAGLTLVEIMFALVLMVIFLAGLFACMGQAQKTDVLTRERAAASEACFAAMDAYLSNPAVDADGTGSFDVTYDSGRSSGGVPVMINLKPVAGNAKVGNVTINANPESNGNVELVEVRVVVSWIAADNTNAEVAAVSRKVSN